MNSLLSRAVELQHAAHTLMYLGMDGEPLYSDDFCRQNKDVLLKSDSLFAAKSSDIEEEARAAGFYPVSLGKRILRTETAGLTMLSILMYQMETAK